MVVLMVVDQIYVPDIAPLKAEDDAPVAGHSDCPVAGEVASQRVQSEARQVHVAGLSRFIETGKNTFDLGTTDAANRLYLNGGDGHFDEAPGAAGADDQGYGMGDRGPGQYTLPAMDHLYRNNGDGTLTDITFDTGINVSFGNGLGIVGTDFNRDGLTDVFVANDMWSTSYG